MRYTDIKLKKKKIKQYVNQCNLENFYNIIKTVTIAKQLKFIWIQFLTFVSFFFILLSFYLDCQIYSIKQMIVISQVVNELSHQNLQQRWRAIEEWKEKECEREREREEKRFKHNFICLTRSINNHRLSNHLFHSFKLIYWHRYN